MMDTNCFSEMSDEKKKQLYEIMWRENSLLKKMPDGGIKKTENVINGKAVASNNSYSFVEGKTAEGLIKIFEIPVKNQELFRRKFEMACGGSGNEKRKIATLHSSSLCALMFFYNVTEEHPLIIDGLGIFTESVFEFRSLVVDERYPSCMDVVLIGKKDDKDVVLFLESKFAEYFFSASGMSSEISLKYRENEFSKEIYTKESLEKLHIDIKSQDDKFQLVANETEKPFYINGLKQMISHYVGIQNSLKGNFCEQKNKDKCILADLNSVKEKITKAEKVYLGEILFDHKIGDFILNNGKKCKDAYADKYEKLAEILNAKTKKTNNYQRFEVLNQELYYSMFTKDKLTDFADKNVMAFYFGVK